MNWFDLYKKYREMPDAELREGVLSLDDMGRGSEVTEIVTGIQNLEIRMRLMERAIRMGAVFTEADVMKLDGTIPAYILVNVARYGSMELGSGDEVAKVLENLTDENVKRAFYERAYLDDVRFTPEELLRIGYEEIDSAHQTVEEDDEPKKRGGLFSWLFGRRGDKTDENEED